MTHSPDAIVVGAGVSGLTAACELARAGLRVVVLEQHTIPGGLLQRFRRRGVAFDSGFHYIGGAGPGGPFLPYLEHLAIRDRIELEAYDPDGFDEVVLPSRRFALPQGMERVEDALCREFPDDASGIGTYFATVAALQRDHSSPLAAAPEPVARAAASPPESPPAPPLADVISDGAASVTGVLDRCVVDTDLRAVLAAHAVLYGVPARRAPIAAHAVISGSYMHSAHGVRGGGEAFSEALVGRLRELGGTLRLRTGVRRVLTDARRVIGVETDDGERLLSGLVVVTLHPLVALRLLADADVPARHERIVRGLRNTPGAVLIHGVARGIPTPELRRNHLWFDAPEATLDEPRPWFGARARPSQFAVLPGSSAPRAPGDTVFQVVSPTPAGDLPEASDPAGWAAAKRDAAQRVIPLVEACQPTWAGRIEVLDVSTPRAVERYVRSPDGSCYGAECSVEQWRAPKFRPTLGLRNFVLTGQSVTLPGVYGCMATAVATIAHVLRGAP